MILTRLFFLAFLFSFAAHSSASITAEYRFTSDNDSVLLNDFEWSAFREAVHDIESQRTVKQFTYDREYARSIPEFRGSIIVSDQSYQYHNHSGQIDLFDSRGQIVTSIPAGRILNIIIETGPDSENAERCPWCAPIAIGIIVQGVLCSGGEAATVAYCNAACSCGVADYSSSCFLGSRTVSCTCQTCPPEIPIPPPPSLFPIDGSWGGSLIPGIPWVDWGNGPYVIPPSYAIP